MAKPDSKKSKPFELTKRQAQFIEEYLIDLNQTQAAIRAGYSKKTAAEQASRLLTDVKIQALIAERMKEREKRTEITQDKVIAELAKIAFSDQRKVMSWGAAGVVLKESDGLSEDDAAIVSEVSETRTATGGSLKLKTHDKVKALELLGRHLGIFADNMNLKHSGAILQENVDLAMLATLSTEELDAAIAVAEKLNGRA